MRSPQKWLLSAGALVLAVLLPELALRLGGFEYRAGVQFGYPDPEKMAFFQPDELLFWRLKPPADPAHPRGDTAGNSRGFPGPDPKIPKPNDAYRALFLGDSCTFQGYPWLAADKLRALGVPAGKRAEAVSMAVPGYTSFQGRRAAETYGQELEPDVVFVYFGWNDHWSAYRQIDSKKQLRVPRGFLANLAGTAFEHSRLVQASAWLAGRWLRTEKPLDLSRVLPEEYRENLLAIRKVFAASQVPVVFVTAPTSFYRLGVQRRLVEEHFAKSEESAIALHRQYNAIVREVAASSGAFLLDLEIECDASPELPQWFAMDGIHFRPAGREWIAGRIAEFLRDDVLAKSGK